MAKKINGIVRNVEMLKENICKIDFESEELARESLPGQFVNLKCGDSVTPLLRRPISICDVDKSKGLTTIVFQLKAAGTKLLSRLIPGDELDLLGPLGKGFDMSPAYERILVVGGGIGTFPLLYLLKESRASLKTAVLGFRDKDFVVMEKEFEEAVTNKNSKDKNIKIFTDNGSYGEKGLVTDGLTKYIIDNKIQIVYACGPTIMLKNVAIAAKEAGVLCQLSVEQRMGCGIGACLVCACKAKGVGVEGNNDINNDINTDINNDINKDNGKFAPDFIYKHVCKDGPVFWADELIFD
jgi:dihydroorotate dehydrogenase electron transfer subunit